MKKHLLGSVALLAIAVSAPAVAADMAVRPAAAPAVTNWSGCYVGGFVGYGYGHSKHRSDSPFGTTAVNQQPVPSASAFTFLAGEQLAAGSTAGFDITPRFNESGLIGGADMGCNIQTGFWVWGFEVDIQDKMFKDGQANDLAPIFNPGFISQTTERWAGTARVRLGYAVDKWMFYATGGYAYASVEATVWNDLQGGVACLTQLGAAANCGSASLLIGNAANPGAAFPSAHDKRIISGYTVGGGTEYALGYGWSAKSEFLYTNYGWHQFFNPPASYWPGTTTFVSPRSVYLDNWSFKWGLNYKFDWGRAAPVVTKY
jgi:outer membrane immunogenic protein